jgi:hypothetical protein
MESCASENDSSSSIVQWKEYTQFQEAAYFPTLSGYFKIFISMQSIKQTVWHHMFLWLWGTGHIKI